MTFDAILDALAAGDDRLDQALPAALDEWEEHGHRFRALLRGFLDGDDLSERTERALFYVTHLLAGQAETQSFGDLCELAQDADRLDSVLGEDAAVLSYPSMLVSTFDGDPAPLYRLIEHSGADEVARAGALLALAYLARTHAVPERATYDYLAGLPVRLAPKAEHFVWFGYARAVAALGFGGLSGAVESAIGRGFLGADAMTSEEFWLELRETQQEPGDLGRPIWDGVGPIGDPIAYLIELSEMQELEGSEVEPVPIEPVRNPMRDVGRNDPCPCGSGKKYKKCCLGTA